MKIVSSVLLFVLFTAVLAEPILDSLNTTTANTSSSVTSEIPSTTTTLEPTTTTVESTTTTITTPVAPQSSTTTSSSSSSPTELPTSTPSPTTAPGPKKCEFNVTDNNVTCIKAELTADFIIDDGGKKYSVMLGCDASSLGSTCSNETQTLVLSESNYTLTMVFEKESAKILVKNVTFNYRFPEGPSGFASNYSEDLFSVKTGHSYLCKSKFDIPLENVTMEIHEIHIQAFLEDGKTYGAIEECEADEKVSDIVPIAVGIALAALIIIVLIAYLVGRRRSRQKGYQSV